MTVHWTNSSIADLRAIEAYISRHSTRYARRMIARIFARASRLSDQPDVGRIVAVYDDGILREVLVVPYRIIYRVSEEQIDIVAVVHSARQLPNDF